MSPLLRPYGVATSHNIAVFTVHGVATSHNIAVSTAHGVATLYRVYARRASPPPPILPFHDSATIGA